MRGLPAERSHLARVESVASVDAALRSDGYTVIRLAGTNRFETAVAIAEKGLGSPTTVFEVTGTTYADALAGGTAAAAQGGAVLLTNGPTQADETAAYLARHPSARRFALGGPASTADPGAEAIRGADRYATAVAVANRFFSGPTTIGFASGTAFADALAGGAQIGHFGGPLLLVPPTGPLPSAVSSYLRSVKSTIRGGFLYGGTTAVADDVKHALETALAH